MKCRVFIISILFLVICVPGISFSQRNRVVVIPLMEDCDSVNTVRSAGGRVWMDRNLGAHRVAQSLDDYQAYGFLYQWGRLADGHEDRGSETTTTLSSGNVPGHDDFITPTSSPYDWRSPQNSGLWQTVLGVNINNPCPNGFRVPTQAEWETERASWNSNDAMGAFASPLKLAMGGYHDVVGETIYDKGLGGYYWSNTVFSNLSWYMSFSNSGAITTSHYRAFGFSVRCIQD